MDVILFLPGCFVARFKMNRNDGFVENRCEFFPHVPVLYGNQNAVVLLVWLVLILLGRCKKCPTR